MFVCYSKRRFKNKTIALVPMIFAFLFMMKIFTFKHGTPLLLLNIYAGGFSIAILTFCLISNHMIKK